MKTRTAFAFSTLSLITLAGSLAVGCSSAAGDEGIEDQESPDTISRNDDPRRLLPGASSRLEDIITAADVSKTFGTPDDKVPYPDTYWPFVEEGIDARWNGESTVSPLEKYMTLADGRNLAAAQGWEHKFHGTQVPGVLSWFGHCPGWTASAMLNAPLKHAAFAKADGQGSLVACTEGETGCTKFEIGDINALQAEVHVDARSRFIGNRCDTKPSEVERDANGRIVRTGAGCQGLNPGALMIVMGDQLKKHKSAMAINAQSNSNTDQIWNQPAYGYHVYAYENLTEAEAANLVAHGTKTGEQTKYGWNDAAKGFARVDVGLKWVTEHGPNLTPFSGASSTREMRMVAVIELDAAPTSANATIIGGEYLEDETVGADRLTVPPFVWIAEGPGPERLSTRVGGNNHNPYVKPSLVAKLVQLAQK